MTQEELNKEIEKYSHEFYDKMEDLTCGLESVADKVFKHIDDFDEDTREYNAMLTLWADMNSIINEISHMGIECYEQLNK